MRTTARRAQAPPRSGRLCPPRRRPTGESLDNISIELRVYRPAYTDPWRAFGPGWPSVLTEPRHKPRAATDQQRDYPMPTLRELRADRLLTIRELAQQAGVAPSSIYLIEAGRGTPRLS